MTKLEALTDLHQQALEAARAEGRRAGLKEGIVEGMIIATSVPIRKVPEAIRALIDKPADPVAEAGVMDWQPIETAPKNGTVLLGWWPH